MGGLKFKSESKTVAEIIVHRMHRVWLKMDQKAFSSHWENLNSKALFAVRRKEVVRLPRPHSGTHCRWIFQSSLHLRSFASVWRHSSSTNHFLMLY